MKTKHLHALQSTRKIALHALCNCFDDLLGWFADYLLRFKLSTPLKIVF
jgi:hypothetical protein